MHFLGFVRQISFPILFSEYADLFLNKNCSYNLQQKLISAYVDTNVAELELARD